MLTVTATDLPRLINCNGSRLMAATLPAIDAADATKDEGNAVHWLAAQWHNAIDTTPENFIGQQSPDGVFITPEMVQYVEPYLDAIAGGEVEVETSHAGNGWNVRGRADAIKYEPIGGHLTICELKYGWRIVEPEMNWTLLSHVAGFIANNPDKPVHTIDMIVFQPRPDHHNGRVRTWRITADDFAELYNKLAATLQSPDDMLHTGDIQCHYCPARADCPAARKAEFNAIEASEIAFTDSLDNKALAFRLDHLKRALQVLKDQEKAYSELALFRVKGGDIVPNYMIETGQTNRQWKGHVTPEFIQVLTGKDIAKRELITPAQAEKAGLSKDVVAALTERHSKEAKIVRVDADAKAKKLLTQPKGN